MKKFKALAQVVGFVTMGLLALYGLLALAGAAGPLGLEARADAEMPKAPEGAVAILGGTMPQTMNYQGLLRNPDGSLTTGVHTITARIYNSATLGILLYETTVRNVAVRDGLFNIVLGDDPALPAEAFSDAPRYIGIDLNDGAGELIPRQRLHAVPWAMTASTLVDDATVNGLTVNGLTVNGPLTPTGNVVGNVRLSSYTGTVQYDSPLETQPLSDYKLVEYHDFETDNDGWLYYTRTQLLVNGSTQTYVLGPVAGATWNGNPLYSASLVRSFHLSTVPHSEVLFRLRYFAFDSWDEGESAWVVCGVSKGFGYIYGGGASIWEKKIKYNDPGRVDYGGTGNSYEDGAYMAEVRCDIPPGVEYIGLFVGATLNEPVQSESLAIDDVEVWVR